MNTFAKQELLRFLAEVDAVLVETTGLVVIGGAAAVMAYDVATATRDIDLWSPPGQSVQRAFALARSRSGLNIPVEHAAVADAPWSFDERLEKLESEGWSRLVISVPERHDLVLMKCVRGYEHDLEAAELIHGARGLDLETLVARFVGEMTHVVGDPDRIALNFRVLVERLFGRAAEARVRQSLALRHRP